MIKSMVLCLCGGWGGCRFETVKYNIYEGHEKGLKRGSRWNF